MNIHLSFDNRDNTEADVLGANLYKRFIAGARVPTSRQMPEEAKIQPQTASSVVPILVMTGVYNCNAMFERNLPLNTGSRQVGCQSHKDFACCDLDAYRPAFTANNVLDAVQYILKEESVV